MRKKSLLLLLLMAVFAPWAAQAQEELTVYEGTTTSGYVPAYMGYFDDFSRSQFVIPADDLAAMNGGTISSIKFYTTNSNVPYTSLSTVDVYLMEVGYTTISAFEPKTDDAIVYQGTLNIVTEGDGGSLTIEFNSPYTYGGGNLLVGIENTTDAGYKFIYFYGQTVTGASGAGANGSSLNNVTFTQRNFIPKTTFTYEVASTGCDYMPTAIAVSDITADGATVTWEGEGDTWNLRYKASTDEEYTMVNGLTSQTYTFEGTLAGNTTYSVGVQADCGDATSLFKSTSFTTQNPCATPTNLQITDVTQNSATLSWTAGYQETTWTVKYKKSTDSEYTTETVNGTPSLTLSGLTSLTTYNVQVYNCENYVSGNFTTAAGIPLNEAFNASSIPAGWAMYTGLLSNVNSGTALASATYGWTFGTGNNVFDSHARVNIYGNYQRWLVMPAVVMEDNVQLTFDLALTVYTSSSNASPTPGNQADDRFIVLITTDGGTTWEILREWNNTGSEYVYDEITNAATGQPVAIDLSSYAGQSIAVAFYGESTETGGDNNLHIDNVSIDYIPACAKPTGLAASDVTAHEATITWTSDATAWQVQLNDEDPIDVEEATYTFENLDPETTYTAKVRANCSGTYSEWTTAVSFTTTIACPAPTALTVTPDGLSATFTWESNADEWEVAYATNAEAAPEENIVGIVNEATYTVNDLELGDYYFWVRANCGDVDGYSQWAGPVSVHIGYCVPAPTSVDNNGISNVTFGMGDYIVNNDTPKATYTDYTSQIGAVQAGVEATIAITFKTSYTYNTYVWVDLDNNMSFDADEVVCYGESTSSNPTTLTLNFTIPADQAEGDFRLRIGSADSGLGSNPAAANPCYSSSFGCFQDYTLRVLEAPSCLTPTAIAIDYTGGTEATISWTSDAEAWNLRVNGVDVEGTITNPYTLTGLELATTYSVEVQANCGEDGTSEWSNAVSFTTDLCMPEDQCEITFELTDSYGDGWNGGAGIRVIDVETNAEIGFMTNEDLDGESYDVSELNTLTLAVCDGREIQFVWVSGTYDEECSYVVKDANGEVIFSGEDAMTDPVNYTVNCGFASYTLEIAGVGEENWEGGKGGYYLIASPVTVDLTDHEMTTGDYDLYAFDQAEDLEWINYKGENGNFSLEPGKGYLYAKKATTEGEIFEFTLTGTAYSGDGEIKLVYDDNAVDFKGWNLLGNPYTERVSVDKAFYVMNEDGEEIIAAEDNVPILPMQGFFVVATEAGQTVTFSEYEAPIQPLDKIVMSLRSNRGNVIDRAIVRIGEGEQLPKFQLNPNHTKVYIPQDGKDYAIVNATEMGEMPVNFKAENNGTYSLSFNAEEMNFAYLHLIDNMTGKEVNLLETPSYSFEANTTDYANRFKLVFATGNNGDDDTFAFFSNGSFVINNEGNATVQVIDVNGRILSSETINGCANLNVKAAAGVYMIRLVNGDNVKVQKVVVK